MSGDYYSVDKVITQKVRQVYQTHPQVVHLGPPLTAPPHLLGDRGPDALGSMQDRLSDRVLAAPLLQLQADVLQDAELQRGQRRLQGRLAHTALREPLEERLWEGGGVSTRCQLVAEEQRPNFLSHLSRDLPQNLQTVRTGNWSFTLKAPFSEAFIVKETVKTSVSPPAGLWRAVGSRPDIWTEARRPA